MVIFHSYVSLPEDIHGLVVINSPYSTIRVDFYTYMDYSWLTPLIHINPYYCNP